MLTLPSRLVLIIYSVPDTASRCHRHNKNGTFRGTSPSFLGITSRQRGVLQRSHHLTVQRPARRIWLHTHLSTLTPKARYIEIFGPRGRETVRSAIPEISKIWHCIPVNSRAGKAASRDLGEWVVHCFVPPSGTGALASDISRTCLAGLDRCSLSAAIFVVAGPLEEEDEMVNIETHSRTIETRSTSSTAIT